MFAKGIVLKRFIHPKKLISHLSEQCSHCLNPPCPCRHIVILKNLKTPASMGVGWIFIHGTNEVGRLNGAIFRSYFFCCPPPLDFSADAHARSKDPLHFVLVHKMCILKKPSSCLLRTSFMNGPQEFKIEHN